MLNQPLPTSVKEFLMIFSSLPTQPYSLVLNFIWATLDDWIYLNSSTLSVLLIDTSKILLSSNS